MNFQWISASRKCYHNNFMKWWIYVNIMHLLKNSVEVTFSRATPWLSESHAHMEILLQEIIPNQHNPYSFPRKKTAGSMYCTFTYIYIGDFHSKLLGKYTNPMDPSWERNQQPKLPIGDTWRVSGTGRNFLPGVVKGLRESSQEAATYGLVQMWLERHIPLVKL